MKCKKMHDSSNSEVFVTESECRKLNVAASYRMATSSQPCSGQVAKRLARWARRARIGSTMLDLVLSGKLLPMGVTTDGEIGFGVVVGELSRAEAKAYRAELAQIQGRWKWTPPLTFRISGNEDLAFILAEPEKNSLRLAVETARKCKNVSLDAGQLLKWSAECRNDQVLLESVLTGDIVPFADQEDRLEFRDIDGRPHEEQRDYRCKLRQSGY